MGEQQCGRSLRTEGRGRVSTLAQTETGDWLITDGKATVVTGVEETVCRAFNRTYSIRGEWFKNVEEGIPYFEIIFVTRPNLELIARVFYDAYSSIPGVASVENLVGTLDRSTRDYGLKAHLVHDSGAVITGGPGTPFVVEELA